MYKNVIRHIVEFCIHINKFSRISISYCHIVISIVSPRTAMSEQKRTTAIKKTKCQYRLTTRMALFGMWYFTKFTHGFCRLWQQFCCWNVYTRLVTMYPCSGMYVTDPSCSSSSYAFAVVIMLILRSFARLRTEGSCCPAPILPLDISLRSCSAIWFFRGVPELSSIFIFHLPFCL